jgi:ATP-dependent DNA helicase RecQ
VQGGAVRLLRADLEGDALRALMRAYRDKREQDRETLERMVFYAQTGQCRWRLLLEHLEGEASFERCRHCDNCLRIARQEAAMEKALQVNAASGANAANGATGANGDGHANGEHDSPARAAFAAGDIVLVKRYGRGQVRQATASEVTVAFADNSLRTFQPEYVKKARGRAAMRA